ncbi:MAG: imidazole glycerol phosphate synthase subunit HisH [Actinomycetota bacterium]|nr:imidazole glycerol phosphate synthase subunit HisH [Actinomycetota bacterium]
MIAIIDYGVGNLRSVEKAFAFLGHKVVITDNPDIVSAAEGLVLPGVGSFGDAMSELETRGLKDPLIDYVEHGGPFLGICLGCQLLFQRSQESPGVDGLGVLPGEVVRFPADLKVPHMGWNNAEFNIHHSILEGVEDSSFFYFVHSYYVMPAVGEHVLMVTDYGVDFASAVARDNLVAFQFHPEKSSDIGLKLLGNFAEHCRR